VPHQHDYFERLRFKFAGAIGGLLTGVRSVETHPSEFVGYVEMDIEDFEEALHEMEFERNPLSYWKYFPGIGHEQGSWRWTEGCWQLHVILYDSHPENGEDQDTPRTYVFAHWEYRWDRYPLKHLRTKHLDRAKGVNRMRTKLNLASIPFANDPTIQ
jgi:hypothetical protein